MCEASRCRRQIILEYFGDKGDPCNNCDTFLNPPQTFDGTIVAQKAISCAYRTDQRFGVSYLIDVLLGKETERIIKFGHNKISTFGIGTEYTPPEWQNLFRQLVSENLLLVDITNYGGIKITRKGLDFLKKKETIQLRKYEGKITNKKQKQRIENNLTNQDDKELYSKLKAKRLEIAKSSNLGLKVAKVQIAT